MASFEGMEEDEETMSEGFGQIDLLWKGVVKPDEPLLASGIDKYFLRITNASFGPDVNKDTRTCLTVVQSTDEESEAPGVICTLKNSYENHQLDLLVSGDVQFQVSGKNPSAIYLTGHLSPAEQHVSENPFALDDDEPTEEELEDMDDQTKRELLKQLGRKRGLAGMEVDDDEDKVPAASQKKQQKNAGGKDKAPQDKNQNKNKNQKNTDNKNQKKGNAESPKGAGSKNEDDKPWRNGPQGLKFKEIREGNGKVVKKGSKVRVHYVGQLENKKIFDKVIDGPGFEFTVGKNEVIKGWELGLNGMKVGGKRRLQIPAKLAYGEEGSSPDIPPNAQLTFTVEVKSVN